MNHYGNIYWIGGSPCAGKTSISKMLVEKYGFKLYRCDDYLEKHLAIGADRNYPIMHKISKMNCDQIWMRPIDIQVHEEFEYYKEEFNLILEDIEQYSAEMKILIEGTAILPEMIENLNIKKNRVVFIVPSEDFQRMHYKNRAFVPYVLDGCTNKNKAFENWMNRDIKFSEKISKQATLNNKNLIVTDINSTIKENFKRVESYFELI